MVLPKPPPKPVLGACCMAGWGGAWVAGRLAVGACLGGGDDDLLRLPPKRGIKISIISEVGHLNMIFKIQPQLKLIKNILSWNLMLKISIKLLIYLEKTSQNNHYPPGAKNVFIIE